MSEVHEPGGIVKTSGIYKVVKEGDGSTTFEVMWVGGERFQLTRSGKWRALPTGACGHLKQNLWLDENYDSVILEDSIARDLDTAMMVRRDNQPGDDTPVGILTKMHGTRYERLIKEIESKADPATLELGFHLLSMAEESCMDVHRVLETITRKAQLDGNRHDVTLASSTPPCGVSFHCNPYSISSIARWMRITSLVLQP